MAEFEPTLYIIMHTDVPDPTDGKGKAQAAHASSQLTDEMVRRIAVKQCKDEPLDEWEEAYLDWEAGRGFGRTIVLEGTMAQASDVAFCSSVNYGGTVYDPTYPIKNMYGVYTAGVYTCSWVFVTKEEEYPEAMRDLPLHR